MSINRHVLPQLVRQQLERRGRVHWHYHSEHQILYPSSGVVIVSTVGQTWVVPPRRAMWLPADQPHAQEALGQTELHSMLFPEDAGPIDSVTPKVLTVTPLLHEALLALTGVALSEPQRARLRAVAVDQLQLATPMSINLPEPEDDRLVAIAEILREDPADSRGLAELGGVVGASERTLSRLFRADTGMSFPQWRSQLRLCYALVGLTAGESVTSVAYGLGYSTPSAFIANFRKAYGTTPGAYAAQSSRLRPVGADSR